jgi:hypothetical protein
MNSEGTDRSGDADRRRKGQIYTLEVSSPLGLSAP